MPVVFEPGSSLILSSATTGSSIATFKIMVNGYCFNTAAFPLLRSNLASPGWIVFNGFLLVSTTKTLLNFLLFLLLVEPPVSRVMVALTMLESGLALQALA